MHINFYNFEEIDALEDVEYLTWEDMAEMDEEAWAELVDGWLALADDIEAEVEADMAEDEMGDEDMDEESDS